MAARTGDGGQLIVGLTCFLLMFFCGSPVAAAQKRVKKTRKDPGAIKLVTSATNYTNASTPSSTPQCASAGGCCCEYASTVQPNMTKRSCFEMLKGLEICSELNGTCTGELNCNTSPDVANDTSSLDPIVFRFPIEDDCAQLANVFSSRCNVTRILASECEGWLRVPPECTESYASAFGFSNSS